MKIKHSDALLREARAVIATRDAAENGILLSLPDHRRKNLHDLHADAIQRLRTLVEDIDLDQ